jgi:SET domain-containing protein
LTFLGIYSGILHPTKESLAAEIQELGENNVHPYLRSTVSLSRYVSAARCGNTLSAINTARPPNATEIWRRDNVASVLAGSNLTCYVTTRAIAAGEELLLDYEQALATMRRLRADQDKPQDG